MLETNILKYLNDLTFDQILYLTKKEQKNNDSIVEYSFGAKNSKLEDIAIGNITVKANEINILVSKEKKLHKYTSNIIFYDANNYLVNTVHSIITDNQQEIIINQKSDINIPKANIFNFQPKKSKQKLLTK